MRSVLYLEAVQPLKTHLDTGSLYFAALSLAILLRKK